MRIPKREGKCCDAVIRQIERASGSRRSDIRDPEKNGGSGSVDLQVKVGGQEYALEHTRVQPFRNRIDLSTHWQTVRDSVGQWFPDPLPGPAFYHLYIPLDMHPPGRGRKGKDRLESLREWIERNVEVLHGRAAYRPRSPGHFYKMDEITGQPSGWKCEFVISRSNDGVVPHESPAPSMYSLTLRRTGRVRSSTNSAMRLTGNVRNSLRPRSRPTMSGPY